MSKKNIDQTAEKKHYQEKLPELSEEEAIELIRANNESFEDKISFHGLPSGPDPELWHSIALRVMDKDPVLGKAMLASLFFGRGGYVGDCGWEVGKKRKEPEFDRDQVIRDLYDAELMHPEEAEISAFSVFYKIIQFGHPDEYYWQDSLRRGLDLSLSLSIPECQDYVVSLLGYIAFYAEENSDLQNRALEGVEQVFQLEKDVLNEAKFCTFCYPTLSSFRQKAFEANPDSKLHEIAFKSFCKKIKEYVKTDFDFRMACLVTGIGSHSDVLREEAATHYIEDFPLFAVGNIDEAYKGLLNIVTIAASECPLKYPPPEITPEYETQVACKVLEHTITELAYIDQALADKIFDSFMGISRIIGCLSPPLAPEGLEKSLKVIRDREWDIKEKKRVYDFFKKGMDLRATLKRKD